MRGRRAPDRGAAAVEFALVLPLLLILIFGIIDFGRLLNAQIAVTEAAREGARMTSFGASLPEVQTRVDDILAGTTLTRPDGPCPTTPDPDRDASVVVSYDFEFVTPVVVLVGIVDSTPTLSATGVMPCHS